MTNGLTYGRATGSIFAGRGLSAVRMANGGPLGRTYQGGFDWATWPRTGGMCAPIQQCCCKLFTIGPGEISSLLMDWSAWLSSEGAQGFNLYEISKAALLDMTKTPPVAADPAIIRVLGDDTPDNSDVAHLISVMPPAAARALIEVAADAPIGATYKLDLCVEACSGCDGLRIRQCDCIAIHIQEC